MQNLGIATVEARLYNKLPYLSQKQKKFSFDISAFNWLAIENSTYCHPILVEKIIQDPSEGTLAACFLAKRKKYADNFIKKSSDTQSGAAGTVVWTAIGKGGYSSGLVRDIINNIELSYGEQKEPIQPDDYTNAPLDYNGPKYADSAIEYKVPPNDCIIFKDYKGLITDDLEVISCTNSGRRRVCSTTTIRGLRISCETGEEMSDSATTSDTEEEEKIAKVQFVNQQVVRDGLWWALESSSVLDEENTPFWMTIKKMESSPTSKKCETVIVITIGADDKQNCYDLVLRSSSARPTLYDNKGGSGGKPNPIDFQVDLSKIWDSEKDIEVGFMTCAGRLIIYVNKVPLVYTRVGKEGDKKGEIEECKIPTGKVKIFATNIPANINLSPMIYASAGIISFEIARLPKEAQPWSGVNYKGELEGTPLDLPASPDTNPSKKTYGIDCSLFKSPFGSSSAPKGLFFQGRGQAIMRNVGGAQVAAIGKFSEEPMDRYTLGLVGEKSKFAGVEVPNGRTPFFFRLKGGAEILDEVDEEGSLIKGIISARETVEAPDYYHVKKTANITLYNENGEYDYLREKQYGIELKWGWKPAKQVDEEGEQEEPDGEVSLKKTFMGVIVDATTSSSAGKETIELHCEDYMYVLNNMPIMNSPFYDGMIAFYAVKDLVQRIGETDIIDDRVNPEQDVFLRSGYGFTKPLLRFEPEQLLLDCVLQVLESAESFVYFDQDGKFHYKMLPGGLFGDPSDSGEAPPEFFSDPSKDAPIVILDEKNIEYTFDSTVNKISFLSVNRDTRLPILLSKFADDNKLLFPKVMMRDAPELGDAASAQLQMEKEAKRVFFPIRKISFKTTGGTDTSITPLSFIVVDDLEFRLLSLTREYSADSNDFVNTYNAEWLYGAGTGRS